MDEPMVNLNPAQAVPSSAPPLKLGALRAEITRGTDHVSFRIPLKLKALVNRYVNMPGSEFQGSLSNFYLLAVAEKLRAMADQFRGDLEYMALIQRLEKLSQIVTYEEPIEQFRKRLDDAEKLADTCVAARNLDLGFLLLKEAVDVVLTTPEPVREALAEMLRQSKPMHQLKDALLADEGYGLSPTVDRLQKFMGGSL